MDVLWAKVAGNATVILRKLCGSDPSANDQRRESGSAARPPSKPMNAPAVNVKMCSDAFRNRSLALGNGSSLALAIQIITPSVTPHSALLIQSNSLNIGLIETALDELGDGRLMAYL
jgi:hypothetical protein